MTENRLDEQTRNVLIELVKTRPILFNDYSDRSAAELRDERQKCWDEVGEKLNWSGDVCKTKFTTLKNNYFKNLRNDAVGPDMRRRLDFLDELAPWNRVQVEKPARISQRRATKRFRQDYNDDSDQTILMNTSTTSVMPDLPVAFKQSKNDDKKTSGEQYGQSAEMPMSPWAQPSYTNNNDVDDLNTFFRNMEQTARKFNARLQVKVKRMISDIIYDAEEQWINTNSSA
ncbi:uncharacterized protein LOC116339308 [Contarinia nasturtii]|uniref:uncharacterized protein LOC116339308 n=1 Tax=Contarinia nasturtii TaxID=265458 RepID=UPI0012D456E9|nr:uncharacterized protein LOC116339308 [Contarinia nasturtii]